MSGRSLLRHRACSGPSPTVCLGSGKPHQDMLNLESDVMDARRLENAVGGLPHDVTSCLTRHRRIRYGDCTKKKGQCRPDTQHKPPGRRPGVACSDEDLASLVEDQDEEQVPGKSSSPTCGMMVAVDYEQILLQCRTWRLSCGRKHRALLERSRALKVPDVLRSACSAACLQLATLERRFTRGLTSQMCGLT